MKQKLFEKLFGSVQPKATDRANETVTTINHYSPSFSNFRGSLFEMEITRSIIHSKAKHSAKLNPHIVGSAYKNLENTLKFKPNEFQSTYDFLYKLRLLYEMDTYVFIIPIMSRENDVIVEGFYPLKADNVEILEFDGITWLRYKFDNGQIAAIEYDRVGIISKMNYRNDFIGDGNGVLSDTMNLLTVQSQGMQEAIKKSAVIEFVARLNSVMRPEDLEAERENFSKKNLSSDNTSGVAMFDQRYIDVKQIERKAYVPDEKQMNYIKGNLFSYFGINEDILQNKFNEDTWNAFYEGEIEPFAIQVSLAMTNMLFSTREKAMNNYVHFSANRLQYASNTTKLNVSQTLFDRGIFGTHDIADIWNMPKVGVNEFYIRKEYAQMERVSDTKVTQVEVDDEVNKEINKTKQEEQENDND